MLLLNSGKYYIKNLPVLKYVIPIFFLLIILSCSTKEKAPTYFVKWNDTSLIPEAVITGGEGHPQAYHNVSGFRLKSYVYLDGTARFLSGEFGSQFFTKAPFQENFKKPILIVGKDTITLDLNMLARKIKTVRILRPGSFEATIMLDKGSLIQTVAIDSIDSRKAYISYKWKGVNEARIKYYINTQVPAEQISDSIITFPFPDYGHFYYVTNGKVISGTTNGIDASLDKPLIIETGYSQQTDNIKVPAEGLMADALKKNNAYWSMLFSRIKTQFTGEDLTELKWSLMQCVTTAIYDKTRNFYCFTNGGMYVFDHLSTSLDQRNSGLFNYQSGNIAVFGLSSILPEICRSQLLACIPSFRHDKGTAAFVSALPGSEYRYKAPGGGNEPGVSDSLRLSSSEVYWFILGLTEYIRVTNDLGILDVKIANAHNEIKTVLEHTNDILRFADEKVGYGPHGLCRFLSGDWNDYLNRIGHFGKGESFFNTALNIISKERLANLYEKLNKPNEAQKLRLQAQLLREKTDKFLTGPWYPRGIDDNGKIIGTDRVFLEPQSWLGMAGCATPEGRKKALLISIEKCYTKIGLTLIDKPIQKGEWKNITDRDDFPRGTGENGGIWWISNYWMSMALASEGLKEKADEIYQLCSLSNHHKLFPNEFWSPFMAPDGIDSPLSANFGKGQQESEGMSRETNPNEVDKYPFKIWYALYKGERLY
jgi:hypothetical protein